MSNGFVHSVKVPRIYKFTADIVRRVREDNDSLKTLIYEKKHPNVSGIYGLSVNTLQALPILDQLLSRTKILIEQPRLDPWLARVLITELLWGKRCLKNNSKPVLTLLTYEHKLHEEARKLGCVDIPTAYRKKEIWPPDSHHYAVESSNFMVLIIRNCRILSSRQNKEARIRKLQDYQRSCRQELFCEKKNSRTMDSVTVLGTLFLYSIAMFTLPFVAFFGVQHFVSLKFQTDNFVTNCVSVLAAVVIVNLIISCYAYQALHESIQEKGQGEVRVEIKENLNKKID